MKCPLCKSSKLINAKYDEVSVKTCASCEGFLVRRSRIARIKTSRTKSDEDFLEELSSPKAVDTTHRIRCPECLSKMVKQEQPIGSGRYLIDECRKCDLAWFDAGELAKLQLNYEESEQGHEMLRFQERLRDIARDQNE